jgi:predicted subunit of tRNA(5-methylaminomethyl-2-thiouridylate) methyltransferase
MNRGDKCVVLFSGGTDSTCVAALMAEKFNEIHLLTFFESGTKDSPIPTKNIELLKEKFPKTTFLHQIISTTNLVKRLSYENYLSNIFRHGFYVLATPGFSTLSWHAKAIQYCKEAGVSFVADGQTKELLHFPGHMDRVIALFKDLYGRFGINYENPVREWDIPPDQQVIDRLIVGRHGYFVSPDGVSQEARRTTGDHLFSLGIFPHRNVKGSSLDKSMQHDCYPFVLYNVFAFWLMIPFLGQERFEMRMESLFKEKVETCYSWLREDKV